MKRANKEDIMWDCSVCTYRNSPEAFKCLMCDVRKGTSTRKPRLNAELVAAQVAQVIPPPKPKKLERKRSEGKSSFKGRPRLKNVDRSTAEHNAVTVNNVTVIITEFQPKQKSSSSSATSSSITGNSNSTSNSGVNGADYNNGGVASSSEAGSMSDTSENKHTSKAESSSPV